MSAPKRAPFRAPVLLASLVVFGACEHAKSSNPLSPTIAGPIAGVEISPPVPLEPYEGQKFRDREQPLTLEIHNAYTTGVRPLFHGFEIAVDSGFKNVIYSRRDVPLDGSEETKVRLADKLELGRTYYWRSWAYDGANTGPYSDVRSFEVYPPSVLHAPHLQSPPNGSTVGAGPVHLRVLNSARSGPIGNVVYVFQVSTSPAFSDITAFANPPQPEDPGGGATSWSPGALTASTLYYWRALATDRETTSDWSVTSSFRTPAAAPSPSPGPVSCSPIPGTAIDILTCHRRSYGTPMSAGDKVNFLRGSAHDMNVVGIAEGPFGLLRKSGGINCGGYSCDVLCSGQGTAQKQWDVLIDHNNAAVPIWGSPHTYPNIRADTCDIQ
ncbi:MAG TPA: hypothetical protein VK886_09885 [Vicinamibacterales bacterium]|nr:hypothetical protein [Vicinamibacterales bacterium]